MATTVKCECGRDVPINPPQINADLELICDQLAADNNQLRADNERLRQLWVPIGTGDAGEGNR